MPLWSPPSSFQSFFSPTYAHARQTWLQAASRSTWHAQQQSFAHPLRGPQGEALATDCLWWGPPDASQVLVLISATHGVEGFAGSAIQAALLQALENGDIATNPNTAVLFIHALTPWGFAWFRRCDEQGIDLNRHFIDFAAAPENPNYARVRPCLAMRNAEARRTALAALAEELGRFDYEVALSGGQYVDPDGPFYGGRAANHGRQVIEALIDAHQFAHRDVVVLDLHTGLGPWAYGELICDHPLESAGVAIAQKRFGANITQPALGDSASVPKLGLLDYAWHRIMNPASCYLTLEFGSYSTDALFDCLIEDHRFWAEYRPQQLDDSRWQAQRLRLLEHFCPADPDWRHSVIFRGLQMSARALASFSNTL